MSRTSTDALQRSSRKRLGCVDWTYLALDRANRRDLVNTVFHKMQIISWFAEELLVLNMGSTPWRLTQVIAIRQQMKASNQLQVPALSNRCTLYGMDETHSRSECGGVISSARQRMFMSVHMSLHFNSEISGRIYMLSDMHVTQLEAIRNSNFDVLLTVHLSTILVINQLNAQILLL